MYTALKFLIRWPCGEEVHATLPECFCAKFSNAVVIIDCVEIFVEQSSNILAQSETWSVYVSYYYKIYYVTA